MNRKNFIADLVKIYFCIVHWVQRFKGSGFSVPGLGLIALFWGKSSKFCFFAEGYQLKAGHFPPFRLYGNSKIKI